jgi:hypothetical protein
MDHVVSLFNTLDTGVITALTAFLAVVFSPLVTLAVARRQLRGSVVSTNRQAWINELRKTVSEYAGVMNLANQRRAEDDVLPEQAYQLLHRSLELESHILLMLNPKEWAHQRISDVTTKARVAVFGPQEFDPEVWNDLWGELLVSMQPLLKAEWERVKRGE